MTRDQLKRRIQDLARQVYSATTVTPEEAIEYDELTKFPELKKVIVDLLTLEYDNF
jgi:predicted transcriptional regulator